MQEIPESDWNYLRTIKDKMLETLCRRLNDAALLICTDTNLRESEKYQRLREHIFGESERVARCFDDWRRSNIIIKLLALQQERLLTEDHLSHLSTETRQSLKGLSEI